MEDGSPTTLTFCDLFKLTPTFPLLSLTDERLSAELFDRLFDCDEPPGGIRVIRVPPNGDIDDDCCCIVMFLSVMASYFIFFLILFETI